MRSSARLNHARTNRRGVAAVLAMMFLALFSTLALGFYASVNTSAQIAGNDQRSAGARLAAESGMQFMKYHLATLGIPAGTMREELFEETFNRLSVKLNGTDNMHGTVVAKSEDESVILVPGPATAYIKATPTGQEFRCEIRREGDRGLCVKVIGRSNTLGTVTSAISGARGVELKYDVAENAANIFNYGVASRSRIHLNSNAKIIGAGDPGLGSVLSTAAGSFGTGNKVITLDGNAQISGEITFTDPSARLYGLSMSSNATVGHPPARSGSSQLQEYLHYDAPEPEFPTVNTDAYKKFAGNPAYGGATINARADRAAQEFTGVHYRNVLIKAHANPIFDNHCTLEGVIYIEVPNNVIFGTGTTIRGSVVTQNLDETDSYDYTDNKIEFQSNTTMEPMEELVGDHATYFPEELTDLTGAMILAPDFTIHINSNFGAAGGSIIGHAIHFDSNASGTVKGSVINLGETMVEMSSNSDITIEARGTSEYPAGVYFGSHYTPLPGTYKEVRP